MHKRFLAHCVQASGRAQTLTFWQERGLGDLGKAPRRVTWAWSLSLQHGVSLSPGPNLLLLSSQGALGAAGGQGPPWIVEARQSPVT